MADQLAMGRSVIGVCGFGGSVVGGFVPELWGSSGFSVAAILFSAVGAVVGVLFGARLGEI